MTKNINIKSELEALTDFGRLISKSIKDNSIFWFGFHIFVLSNLIVGNKCNDIIISIRFFFNSKRKRRSCMWS